MKGSKNQVVEAHKFVLALRSDVFRAQFYGSLKSEEEEVKTDWNYKDFKFFISTFYDQVDLRKRSLQSLSGLFHHSSINSLLYTFYTCLSLIFNKYISKKYKFYLTIPMNYSILLFCHMIYTKCQKSFKN